MAREEIEKWENDITREIVYGWAAGREARVQRADEIAQNALIHWWKKKFEKGYEQKPLNEQEALLRTVVGRYLNDVHKGMRAQKRSGYLLPADLDDNAAAPGIKNDPELRALIDRAYPEITPRQRKICDLLKFGMKGGMREIARRLKISPTTLYKEKKRIENILARHGLGDRRIW